MRYGSWVARAVLGLVLVAIASWSGCVPARPAPLAEAWPDHVPLLAPTGAPTVQGVPPVFPRRPGAALASSRRNAVVWVGGEGILTLVGPAGWQCFPLPETVRDIAVDAQGNAILAPGLRMCDGRLLRDLLPQAPGGEQDAVALDRQGRIWVGYYGGIAILEGGRWRVIPLEGPSGRIVRDLAIDAHGVAWVATEAGLARYDGRSWQHYDEQSGLGGSAVECVMIDREGCIWAGHEKGLSVLRGTTWQHFPLDEVSFVRGLAADQWGRIVAGSLYHGLSVFDGTGWEASAGLGSGLPSDRVTALAVDEVGRIWAGTRLGLSVFDGERWHTYQEANSGLGDNQVTALAVGCGALSLLPPVGPARYGRLVGLVTLNRQPVGGARVVLCSALSLAQGFVDNPCENAPFGWLTRTGGDGGYAFDWVPAGHYAVAAEVKPGRWVTRMRVLAAVRYPVREGETTVAETIEGLEH